MSAPGGTSKPVRSFVANVVLFDREGQVARLVLPDGHRFVAMCRGEAATMLPIDDPGEYTADVAELRGAGQGLPVVIAALDLAHVPAWLALTPEQCGQIINRTVAEAARRRASDARH